MTDPLEAYGTTVKTASGQTDGRKNLPMFHASKNAKMVPMAKR